MMNPMVTEIWSDFVVSPKHAVRRWLVMGTMDQKLAESLAGVCEGARFGFINPLLTIPPGGIVFPDESQHAPAGVRYLTAMYSIAPFANCTFAAAGSSHPQ